MCTAEDTAGLSPGGSGGTVSVRERVGGKLDDPERSNRTWWAHNAKRDRDPESRGGGRRLCNLSRTLRVEGV